MLRISGDASPLTALLLLLLIISAAQFLCITLQRVASGTGVLLRPRLRPDQVSSQAELLFKSGSLKVGTADDSEITVLQGPVEGTSYSSDSTGLTVYQEGFGHTHITNDCTSVLKLK